MPSISDEHKDIEASVTYWEGSLAVRDRFEARQKASAEIILFLEYFPENLHQWFSTQVSTGAETAISAVKMVENNLEAVTSFISTRGLLHFDAHFRNILTDGHSLYLTDFGLATCSQFELSEIESRFFKSHLKYDRCLTVTNFVNLLATTLVGDESRDSLLTEYATGQATKSLDHSIASIMQRYAPVAIVMNRFYRKFQIESRTAQFPAAELESVCSSGNLWSE